MASEQFVTDKSLIAKRRSARSALPTLGSRIFVATVAVTLACLTTIWLGVDRGLFEFSRSSNEARLRDARMSLDAALDLRSRLQLAETKAVAMNPEVASLLRLPRAVRSTETARRAVADLQRRTTQDLVIVYDASSRFVSASTDLPPRDLQLASPVAMITDSGVRTTIIARIGEELAMVTRLPVKFNDTEVGSVLCAEYVDQAMIDELEIAVGTDLTLVDDERVDLRSGRFADHTLTTAEHAALTQIDDVTRVHRMQLGGMDVFAVAKPISERTRILLSRSSDDLLALHDTLRGWLLPATLLIILATLLISRQVSRRLASPIAVLATIANELASGRLETSVPTDARTAEIARLQDAFGEMTSRLRALLEDVQGKNETLAAQRDELARANRAKSNFLATASHELRTPIASIQSFSEILLAGDVDDEPEETRIEFLGIIRGESERLARLVEQLLDLATIESGVASWSNEDVDLAVIVRKTLRALAGLGQAQDVELRFEPPETPLTYRGDADRLQQTLTNLVGNAIKFSPRGGVVDVSILRDSFGYQIRVDDEGPGVPEAERGRIFEKFVQSEDILTNKPNGSGLGLAIVREIVQVHGGRVRCEEAPSGGARFVARLPEPHAMRPLERFVAQANADEEAIVA